MGKHSQYGVILDAGSSGTRLYVYKWEHPVIARKHAKTDELQRLPRLKLKKSKKIHPGIATFSEDAVSVGHDYLQHLIETALREVPRDKVASTPIYVMATAGVRYLPKARQEALLQGVCHYLKRSTDFLLASCDEQVRVISGETEGLYGWIATNYLLGALDQPGETAHGKDHYTFGFLDMGGASAQIAFAPNRTEAERHANDLKLIRLRHLDGSMKEHKVFTATWLGFGANQARLRYVQSLLDSYGDSVKEIADPCMPRGLHSAIENTTGEMSKEGRILIGTGIFPECLKKTYPLLERDAPCDDHPCLLNGQHVPAIDFEVNHFVGVSEYWHATHGVFGQKKKEAYDLATYQQKVAEFCSQEWTIIEKTITKRKKSHDERVREAQDACFKASWLINILYEGIGIPRLGVDLSSTSNLSTTIDSAEGVLQVGSDSFQPIDTVHGMEVTWTLGKMLLYAAGQIAPVTPMLPVGFGSNVASTTAQDFEHAGSTPLVLDSDDYDETTASFDKFVYQIISLALILSLVAYLLRKPERRHRLLTALPWPRRRPWRKQKRRSGFMSRLFGRGSSNYERVLEDGENADLELEATPEDASWSDGNEMSRGTRQAETTPPKAGLDRPDEVNFPSVMDRTGLVVRTESRERLTTKLQMLNAGKRSRAASPTRLKSPSVIPTSDLYGH